MVYKYSYSRSSREPHRFVWMFIGILVVLIPLSLISGGFVIYINHIAIAFASKPILILVLEFLIILLVCSPIVYLLMKLPIGFLKGFFTTIFIMLTLYAFASTVALVLYLILTIIILIIIAYEVHRGWFEDYRVVKLLKFSLALIPLLVIYIFTSLYVPIASSRGVEFIELSKPVDVNALKRFIPLMTAYTYAVDRLQIPTHRMYAKDSYVYFANGRSVYNWVVEPQGFWNEVTKPPRGFMFVYGDTYPPQVEVILRDTVWGLHNARFYVLFFDTLYRQIVLRVGLYYKPIMENNIKIVYNNELLILIPVMKWDRGLLHSIPIIHGYAVIHEDGSIEFVDAKKALVDPRFRSLPVVPEVIAREWVELRRFYVGFIDFYLYRNTYTVRDIGTNPQPYLSIDKDNKIWWVFVAEPPGEAYSAKYIMYVDPSNLRPSIYIYTLPTPMIGISRVESYIKQHYPMFDWSQLVVEEPTPILINDTLYWKVTVTTKDFRGLVLVALVNAKTGTVTSIDVTKWDTQTKGNLTAGTILQLISKPTPTKTEEETKLSIEDRIKQLEQLIQQIKDMLNQLEKELNELKRQLTQK